jgi:hypothetical protein
VLAACLWASDNIDAAKDAVAALRTDYHGVTSDEFSAWFPYADQELNQPVKDALRGAGWH